MKILSKSRSASRGFTLIEVLIGIAILALGLMSVAAFQSTLMRDSGYSKARSEAVNLAEAKMEELRNLITEVNFNAIAPGNDNVNGVNARFTRTWTVENLTAPVRKRIGVNVAWSDPANAPQRVAINSTVAFLDPRVAAGNSGLGLPGGALSSPSGGELYPGLYIPKPVDAVSLDPGNTFIVYDASTGKTYLANEHVTQTGEGGTTLYQVILEVNGEGIVLLAGDVNRADAAKTVSLVAQQIEIETLTSDAGYCVFPSRSPAPGITLFTGVTGERAPYYCYVGRYWYGNVGIVGMDSKDDVCPQDRRSFAPYVDSVAVPAGSVDLALWQHYLGDGVARPTSLVKMVKEQDFTIMYFQGQGNCANLGDPGSDVVPITISVNIAYTGPVWPPATVTANPTAGDPTTCSAPAQAGGSWTCAVSYPQGVNGWTGYINVTPAQNVQVCGAASQALSNVTSSITGASFSLAPTGQCQAETQYTYKVVVGVTDSIKEKQADAVSSWTVTAVAGTGTISNPSCSKKSGNNNSATYHCVVTGTSNTQVSLLPANPSASQAAQATLAGGNPSAVTDIVASVGAILN